uniref:KH-type splicing regulatory protein n=1 Tax=Myripristis murdjan TaxID=586833 RepID=A0A667ZMV7_9TELE
MLLNLMTAAGFKGFIVVCVCIVNTWLYPVILCFQIAAKIGGDAVPPMSNNGGAESYPFPAQKRSLEDAGWRSMHVRPSAMTEEYRVPDGMVGLIIGRGGEQINKIQQDSGCKVQIAPDSGGLPERSVSLTGTADAIQKAKRFLDEIVSRGRGTPPSFHESTNGQAGSMQEMIIPAGKAGLIIGKGGETIKQLQERAGVKMILIQDGSQPPNIDKPLRIIGDPYKVQQAKEMVNEILRERDHAGFGERNEYGSRMGGGGGGIDVPVPRHSVGVVIGRNGEMIKKIQNDAGVRIQFKPDDGVGPEKIAHVMGPPDRCEHAVSIINDLLQSIRAREEGMPPGGRGRGRGQGSWGPPGGEMTFSIPAHKCGLVIGRGGENVKAINQQTGAFVEISHQPPPNGDPNFKLFTIRGSPQQIDHAKQLIEDKIEHLMAFHIYTPQDWGNTYQQWQSPAPHDPSKAAADHSAAWAAYYAQYYNQQPGGPDYTKAWEEYYKKMGMTAAGGQQDYSAAWAEYYRQQAAYYGQAGDSPLALITKYPDYLIHPGPRHPSPTFHF